MTTQSGRQIFILIPLMVFFISIFSAGNAFAADCSNIGSAAVAMGSGGDAFQFNIYAESDCSIVPGVTGVTGVLNPDTLQVTVTDNSLWTAIPLGSFYPNYFFDISLQDVVYLGDCLEGNFFTCTPAAYSSSVPPSSYVLDSSLWSIFSSVLSSNWAVLFLVLVGFLGLKLVLDLVKKFVKMDNAPYARAASIRGHTEAIIRRQDSGTRFDR